MRKNMVLSFCALAAAACASAERGGKQPFFHETIGAHSFYRGNIHTHTNESDGDAPVQKVVDWYRHNGYQFLSITDHNKLVVPRPKIHEEFLLLPGDELSSVADGKVPIHVNAICGKSELKGERFGLPTVPMLQKTIDTAKADGALAMVNHPNFGWALSAEQLLQADGFELLEITSGHPLVYHKGDSAHASAEEIWDVYLSKKHRVYGVAVDDSHDFYKFGDKERNPGRAWIQAWAPELSEKAICDALARGHFYSSTGSKITSLVVTPKAIELAIEGWIPSDAHVDFIGAGGVLLHRSFDMPARYNLRGGEGYVMAHVYQSKGREAWTQAYFIKYE